MNRRTWIGQTGGALAATAIGASRALARIAHERGVPIEALTTSDSEAALRPAEPSLPVLPNFLQPNGAASVTTTAGDFGRFLQHMLRVHGSSGPSAGIATRMLTPQVRINDELHWGLGTGLEVRGGQTTAWHWGDNPGFKNFYVLDPQAGSAIVVFTSGDGGQGVYERTIRAETGEDRAAFLFI